MLSVVFAAAAVVVVIMLCDDVDLTTDSLISSSKLPAPLIGSCFDGSTCKVAKMSLFSAKVS